MFGSAEGVLEQECCYVVSLLLQPAVCVCAFACVFSCGEVTALSLYTCQSGCVLLWNGVSDANPLCQLRVELLGVGMLNRCKTWLVSFAREVVEMIIQP